MVRVLLNMKYGRRALSKDERVSSCFVYRPNLAKNRMKRVKLFFVNIEFFSELVELCSDYKMDFIISGSSVDIDDEHFDASLLVSKRKET